MASQGKEPCEHCRESLSTYKRPKTYEVVAEIPLTGYGKYDKKLLRAARKDPAGGVSAAGAGSGANGG
jgi:acyl-CoA synthetase (AMP-forming)/AMP-acid ligase II